MAIHFFSTQQNIPADLSEVWQYFSDPSNLKRITPSALGFEVISEAQPRPDIYAGQVIEYRVSPLLGIPLYWMTEITHVKSEQYFVDEQRQGPYSLWHHQHHFKKIAGGVEMTDMVHYKIPGWFLGDMVNSLLVKAQLQKIFHFRHRQVEAAFGAWPGAQLKSLQIR